MLDKDKIGKKRNESYSQKKNKILVHKVRKPLTEERHLEKKIAWRGGGVVQHPRDGRVVKKGGGMAWEVRLSYRLRKGQS